MGSKTNPQWVLAALAHRFVAVLLAMLALACWAAPAQAQTVTRYTNSTASAANAISDTATPCNNPFRRTLSVGTSYLISDVNIGVLMAHTYHQDLVITLVSPSGTRGRGDEHNRRISRQCECAVL